MPRRHYPPRFFDDLGAVTDEELVYRAQLYAFPGSPVLPFAIAEEIMLRIHLARLSGIVIHCFDEFLITTAYHRIGGAYNKVLSRVLQPASVNLLL